MEWAIVTWTATCVRVKSDTSVLGVVGRKERQCYLKSGMWEWNGIRRPILKSTQMTHHKYKRLHQPKAPS